MKKSFLIISILFTISSMNVYSEGTKVEKNTTSEDVKYQTTCPVTGNEIDKNFFADFKGKRIYFCCGNCAAEFVKDPAGYVKKLTDEGITLQNTPKPQTMCPVMNAKIDKKLFADYQNKRVYFCCSYCIKEFNKNPQKYIDKLEKEGITLEEVPSKEK